MIRFLVLLLLVCVIFPTQPQEVLAQGEDLEDVFADPVGWGKKCQINADCLSGHCYPGPDAHYCIIAKANCARPGNRGSLYGESYSYDSPEGFHYECYCNIDGEPSRRLECAITRLPPSDQVPPPPPPDEEETTATQDYYVIGNYRCLDNDDQSDAGRCRIETNSTESCQAAKEDQLQDVQSRGDPCKHCVEGTTNSTRYWDGTVQFTQGGLCQGY